MSAREDRYLDDRWVHIVDAGYVVRMEWLPASEGPRRPAWPAACHHTPLHADCNECYLFVKGWPRK